MKTFGFRGEALSSISQVANVTITTKTRTSACAIVAKYHGSAFETVQNLRLDGKRIGEIRSSAGVDGTTITVENLFEKLPSRRKSFRASDETNRVADVVTKYAILKPLFHSSNAISEEFHSLFGGEELTLERQDVVIGARWLGSCLGRRLLK